MQGLTNGIQEGALTYSQSLTEEFLMSELKPVREAAGSFMIYTNARAHQQYFEAGWNIECPISIESWKDVTWIYLGAEWVQWDPYAYHQ